MITVQESIVSYLITKILIAIDSITVNDRNHSLIGRDILVNQCRVMAGNTTLIARLDMLRNLSVPKHRERDQTEVLLNISQSFHIPEVPSSKIRTQVSRYYILQVAVVGKNTIIIIL